MRIKTKIEKKNYITKNVVKPFTSNECIFNNNLKFQGTLMALVAFYQGQVLNKFRSAALLSPIAHMNQMTSILTKIAAVAFLANVRDRRKSFS